MVLSRYLKNKNKSKICEMGFFSDLLYRDNPKRREKVQALADSIGSDVKFIEKATNDTIERINKFMDVKRERVTARGKTINEFLLEVREAFEELGRNAEGQYRELCATVDTSVVERVRRKVEGLELRKMREAIRELEIAGVTMGKAVAVVASLATTEVTMHLERTAWASASNLGGIVAGALAGTLVFVMFEAISGAVERAELERRIRELTKAEETMHDNRVAIVNSAQQLYVALIVIQLTFDTDGHMEGHAEGHTEGHTEGHIGHTGHTGFGFGYSKHLYL
jgi:hypothetical protein